MASVEITITSFLDLIPWLKKTKLRKVVLVSTICSVYFLLGMPCCTQAGTYWVDILDNYSGSYFNCFTHLAHKKNVKFSTMKKKENIDILFLRPLKCF